MYFNPTYDADNLAEGDPEEAPYLLVDDHFHTQEMKPSYYDFEEGDRFYTVMDAPHEHRR